MMDLTGIVALVLIFGIVVIGVRIAINRGNFEPPTIQTPEEKKSTEPESMPNIQNQLNQDHTSYMKNWGIALLIIGLGLSLIALNLDIIGGSFGGSSIVNMDKIYHALRLLIIAVGISISGIMLIIGGIIQQKIQINKIEYYSAK